MESLNEYISNYANENISGSKKSVLKKVEDAIDLCTKDAIISKISIYPERKTSKNHEIIWSYLDLTREWDVTNKDAVYSDKFPVSFLIISTKYPTEFTVQKSSIYVSRHFLERMLQRTEKQELSSALECISDIIVHLYIQYNQLCNGDEDYVAVDGRNCAMFKAKEGQTILTTHIPYEKLNSRKQAVVNFINRVAYCQSLPTKNPVTFVKSRTFTKLVNGVSGNDDIELITPSIFPRTQKINRWR